MKLNEVEKAGEEKMTQGTVQAAGFLGYLMSLEAGLKYMGESV